MVPRTKVPSWERMFQGTNSLGNEYSSILVRDRLGLALWLGFGLSFRVFSQYYPELLPMRNITCVNSQGPLNFMSPKPVSLTVSMLENQTCWLTVSREKTGLTRSSYKRRKKMCLIVER